jgi:hypothetical protein
MHRTVTELMVAEHAATGNDHLKLVGLVEVRPGDGARPFSTRKAIGWQRIVGRPLIRWQGVAVGADIGGVPAGRRLASAGAAGEDAVGSQDHVVLRYCCRRQAQRRVTMRCHTRSQIIAEALLIEISHVSLTQRPCEPLP